MQQYAQHVILMDYGRVTKETWLSFSNPVRVATSSHSGVATYDEYAVLRCFQWNGFGRDRG